MKPILLSFLLLLLFSSSYAQPSGINGKYISAQASYLELKDTLNHGLVYRGPDVSFTYGYQQIDSSRYFNYHASLGGGGKVTNGTWGFTWLLSPADVYYGWRIAKRTKAQVYLGPSLQINYLAQNYPAMHAGPISWLSSYDLGVQLSGFFQVKNKNIELQLRNTLVGLSSRPAVKRDPYYFSTSISENFADLHSNMVVGTISTYNLTELNASLFFNRKKRTHALSYTFQYAGYFNAPAFRQVYHGVRYTWYGRKKE